jgi:hypothetical protein
MANVTVQAKNKERTMLTFMLYLVVMSSIISVVVTVPPWVASRWPKSGDLLGFFMGCASSFALSFAVDLLLLAILGTVPSGTAIAPIFTWSALAFAGAFSAFSCARSPAALAIPFFLNSAIAGAMVWSHFHNLVVAVALLLAGVSLLIAKRADRPVREGLPGRM